MRSAVNRAQGGELRRIIQPGFPFFRADNPFSAFRALYGKRDFEQDGSYVTTEWVSLAWLPLMPFRSLRVIDDVDRRSSFLDRTLGRFIDIFLWEGDLVEEVPLSLGQVASTYVFLGGLVVILTRAFGVMPEEFWVLLAPWLAIPAILRHRARLVSKGGRSDGSCTGARAPIQSASAGGDRLICAF